MFTRHFTIFIIIIIIIISVDEASLKDTLSRTVGDIINEFIKPDYYNLIYRSM